MNAVDTLLQLAGPTLLHVTVADNLPSIVRSGLRPAATLAHDAGVDPAAILLRTERVLCGQARLNHQLPFCRGLALAPAVLDGHTVDSWARQLDARVFFWPSKGHRDFTNSIARDYPVEVLQLDTARFAERLLDRTFLSPINSGAFLRRPARRGDWLYVPLAAGAEVFRENRRQRGLVSSRDSLREVSVTGPISADDLETIRA